jgi:hypothetical protein
MLYVAMTRAATNSAVIYQRITGEADHEHSTPRRALTPTTGVLTGAPVIGKIDRMRIGPSPRRAGAARSTDIIAVASCRPSVGSRRSSSSASATSIDGSGPPTSVVCGCASKLRIRLVRVQFRRE